MDQKENGIYLWFRIWIEYEIIRKFNLSYVKLLRKYCSNIFLGIFEIVEAILIPVTYVRLDVRDKNGKKLF